MMWRNSVCGVFRVPHTPTASIHIETGMAALMILPSTAPSIPGNAKPWSKLRSSNDHVAAPANPAKSAEVCAVHGTVIGIVDDRVHDALGKQVSPALRTTEERGSIVRHANDHVCPRLLCSSRGLCHAKQVF